MKYNRKEHGRTSATSPATDALRQEWEMVGQLPEGDGEWVPRSTVFFDDDINPRENANIDRAKVKEYAAVFRQLPPILVQRDTFKAIDGWHRGAAAFDPDASTLHIRIKEVDVPDSELREAAFRANSTHGRQLTVRDRIAYLKYLIVDKKATGTDAELAKECGLSRSTVIDHRLKWTGPRNNRSTPEPKMSETDISSHNETPQPAPAPTAKNKPVTRTREAVEPEYEEPTREVEDWPDEDDPEDAPEKFDALAFKDHEYRPDDDMVCLDCGEGAHRPWYEDEAATLEADPDSEIPGTIEEAPFGILAINDDGTAEGRIVDGDGAPSAVTQGEVEQLPLVAPSPAQEWFEARRKPAHSWLTGLSDAALTYISALETAALTSDEVVAEVEAHAEACKEARWHRATIAEQDRVPA